MSGVTSDTLEMPDGGNRLPVLAAEIRIAHKGMLDAAKTAADRAVEAGQLLLEAKALVKHGQWLPWLKQHCGLSERSAQFYMKIAKLGLKSETVAVLGLKAASQTIAVAYPDPFAEKSPEDLWDWQLYLLMGIRHGYPPEQAESYIHWLGRQGWTDPDEWLGERGQHFRKFWKMDKHERPDTPAVWAAIKTEFAGRPDTDIAAAIEAAAGGAR